MVADRRRVVITGVGLVSPLGIGKQALWEALRAQRSGIAPISAVPVGDLPVRVAGEALAFTGKIDDFGPLEKEQGKQIRKGLKMMCRDCQMGVAAAQMALADAGWKSGALDPVRTGVSFGVDYVVTLPEEFLEGVANCLRVAGRFQMADWAPHGLTRMSPLWLLKYLPNMPASHLAIYNDLRGPNNSITLREAAGNVALGEAYQIIARGDADVMLVGATGSRLNPMRLLHAVQQEELAEGDQATARPFDRDRAGMVVGEGAGSIVIEDYASAKARGATIYGEVVAAANSAVVDRRLQAHRDQAIQNVLNALLAQAGLQPEAVGHLHAHGAGSRSADREEATAIAAVFGGRAKPLPVVAAKSYFGNLGAGSGLVELIASVLAMQSGMLFPVLNYQTPDPECPVAAVRNDATPAGSSFLSVNVTPQGQASGVAVAQLAG